MDVPPHHTLCTLLVQLPTLSTIVPFSRNFSTQNSLPNFGILTSVDRNSSLVPISKKVQHLDLTRLPSPPQSPVNAQRQTPNPQGTLPVRSLPTTPISRYGKFLSTGFPVFPISDCRLRELFRISTSRYILRLYPAS